jgi:hemolysin III
MENQPLQTYTKDRCGRVFPTASRCPNCAGLDICVECVVTYYLRLCEAFGTTVDPSVLTGIWTQWSIVHVTAKSSVDVSILPAIMALGHLTQVRELMIGSHAGFGHKGDGNWICRSISVGLPHLHNLRVLDLQRLGIDGRGLSEAVDAICSLPNLTELILRYNYLGYHHGTDALIRIIENAPASLRYIDIACNSLGYMNVRRIERSAKAARNSAPDLHILDSDPRVHPPAGDSPVHQKATKSIRCCNYEIDVEGNFVVEEVWNSVLHGLGVILGLVGTYDLLNKAKGQTEKIWWACLVYGLSATILFTASTLYHSSFLHERARRVFQMLDHSAIFILIAGTYTPIGLIALSNVPAAEMMVLIEWVIALLGITIYLVSAHFPKLVKSLPYVIYEVVLYVVMGHMCFISYENIIVPMDKDIMFTLLLGGILYVVGVVFYVLESVKRIPIMHCIWHIFVLAAAICHYFSVRHAVVSRLYESAHTADMMASARAINPFPHIEL